MKSFLAKSNKLRGFTLVEVLVAVSLFITILTLAMGALFQAQSVNARLSANQVVLDGLNLSFETMTRDIRFGSIFNCSSPISASTSLKRMSCPFDISGGTPGTEIVFKPVDAVDPDDRIGYYATSSKIYKWSYIGHVIKEPVPVTGEDVSVGTLQFYVTGANTTQQAIDGGNIENAATDTPDVLQPVINIMVTGKTLINQGGPDAVKFQLQTTVTPRGVDN